MVNFLNETLSETRVPEQIPLDRVFVIILGGGEGKRLEPLTKMRCKPAITFGGRYTLIDVPLSHALSSGLKNIFVIGQYLAYTLQKHLFQTYQQGMLQSQIQMLVPEEREGKKIWYKGTADAIRQNLNYFSEVSADYFLILSGDQLYNINFQEMIHFAVETQSSMVIAAQPVNEKDATRMGLLKIEKGGTKLIDFYEKPKEKAVLDQYYTDDLTLHGMGYDAYNEKKYLASMGIYLFKRQALFDLLQEDPREDFGKHLIKTQMEKGDVNVFLYDGYWEDIGTIESYYHANLALTRQSDDRKKGFQFYNEKHAIFTKAHHLPGAKIFNTVVSDSIICEGSIVQAAEVTHSILGVRSVIGKGTIIRDSILIGNEFYDKQAPTPGEKEEHPFIDEGCFISHAIIDENVTIGKGVKLVNQAGLLNAEGPEGVIVRDGIIIVPRGTHLPDGFVF